VNYFHRRVGYKRLKTGRHWRLLLWETFFIFVFLFVFAPCPWVVFFPESSLKANGDYILFYILRNWIRSFLKLFAFCQHLKLWTDFYSAIFRTFSSIFTVVIKKFVRKYWGRSPLSQLWPDFNDIFIIYFTSFGTKYFV